jgi:diguanylate cyclase (GGDEF)-like protein/PAS domain S-box-containing protein
VSADRPPRLTRAFGFGLGVGVGRNIAIFAAVAAVVAVIALAGFALPVRASSPLPLWPHALALTGGVMLALCLRVGLGSIAAAGLGLAVALWLGGTAAAGAAWLAGIGLVVGVAAAALVLRLAPFDPRLERAADIGWLAGASVLVAAPFPLLAVMAGGALGQMGIGADSPTNPADGLVQWGVLAFGTLLGSTLALLADRPDTTLPGRAARWLPSLAPAAAWMVAVGLCVLAARQGAWPLALLPLFIAPAVLAWLATLAGTAVAGAVLLATAIGAAWAVQAQALGPAAGSDGIAAGVPLFTTALAGSLWLTLAAMLATRALHAEAVRREQRWLWALDGSRLGVADWSLRSHDSFTSAAWQTLAPAEAAHWTPELWLCQVHADDRPALEQAVAQVAAGDVGRLRLELRMPCETGWRWAEATLLVVERSADDRPARLLATLADVDERHAALERQRLSGSLFQHLHEGLLIADADLRVLDANPAYTRILGLPRAELIGRVPTLLQPSPADPLARQQRTAMWSSLRATGHWRGELVEQRRNGEVCTLQATVSTVLGPNQDLRYHVLTISDISEQRAQRDRLERQTHYDELTRLPNRARLSQLLADAMLAADRDGHLLVVCYLDVDRFKPINDRFGHAAGDRLLVDLANRLRNALRGREHWTDTVARLGGDEFGMLLRAATIEQARQAVERVLQVVAQPFVIDPAADAVSITASVGATVYPIDSSDADTLLRHADHAMYGAKQSGRNGYLFFDPEFRRLTEERVIAIGRVQEALDQSEFVLHYQPKVDMRDGRVLGFEALLRWQHPQQGLIAPLEFLPLIDNTGLSARVGDWVFSRALEQLAGWRRMGLDLSVSVNVSARHLQEPDFAQRLAELLARHAEPLAAHVELEILETTAHADIEATSALLERCRRLGVRFARDDIRPRYSTPTNLKRLPVDVLKIDRSFIHHMLDDAQDRGIVEGVIGLARTFGCTVVAEGVESAAQARTLLDLGCAIGQGTGLAAPMAASQVPAWVRDYRGIFALAPAAVPRVVGAGD